MELKYMQHLKDNPGLSKIIPLKGLEERKIMDLRSQFNKGKLFPKAFEEYLLVGGESEATGMVYEYEDWEEIREDCEEDLEYCGYSMERPYFVFDRLDGQSSIFYLDEEDEDPKIYILDPYGKKEGEFPLVRPSFISTFSGLINEAIHRIQNDISF